MFASMEWSRSICCLKLKYSSTFVTFHHWNDTTSNEQNSRFQKRKVICCMIVSFSCTDNWPKKTISGYLCILLQRALIHYLKLNPSNNQSSSILFLRGLSIYEEVYDAGADIH